MFDVVVDNAHRTVFVSGGEDSSQVVMVDFDGSIKGRLTGISEPSGMEIVGSTLYVAASGAARIERYDLNSFPPTKLSSLSTAPLTDPRHLVYLGGKLWFTSGCNQSGDHVSSMNLNGSGIQDLVDPNASWDFCPRIDGGASAPNRLFVWGEPDYEPSLYEYNVGDDPPTLVKTQWQFASGDLEPSPSGSTFEMVGCDGVKEYGIDTFYGPVFTYTSDTCEDGVALTTGGESLLAASSSWGYGTDVALWRLGDPAPFRTIQIPPDGSSSDSWLYRYGIAVSADASRVFVMSGFVLDTVYFYAIDPSKFPTRTTLTASSYAIAYGNLSTLTAQLHPPTPGAEIKIFRRSRQGHESLVAAGNTNGEGRFYFEAEPDANTTYVARYPGASTWMPSSSRPATVKVAPVTSLVLRGSYGTSNGYPLFHKAGVIRERAAVAPNHAGHPVYFELWKKHAGSWVAVDTYNLHELGPASSEWNRYERLARGTYRTRAWVAEHRDHLESTSTYKLFKVTK
jgi:hypothetical protein